MARLGYMGKTPRIRRTVKGWFLGGSAVVLALVAMLGSCVAYSADLIRGPYLQMGGSHTMTVRWRTNEPTDSIVRYGYHPKHLNKSAKVNGLRTEHIVTLSDLAPHKKYYYSIGATGSVLAGGDLAHRFKTSPVAGHSKPTRIWLIGDSGTANANAQAVYQAYLNYPGAEQTDLWLMLGDNAYNSGTDAEYQRAVFDMYPELLARTPLWSTLGNHDGYSASASSETGPYFDIFSLPRQGEIGGLASGTEAYYSFDYGNIHFICLDSYQSSRATDGAMLSWVKNDIAATDKDWIIAFWHHPPYTKGSHDSDTETELIDMRENALPILESYGVDMVFAGHSHSYERSYLMDGHYGNTSTFDAAKHIVDGGSGREDETGAYKKQRSAKNGGAVYTVAGASGKISGGALNHPAMFLSLNELGSVVLDVNHHRLEFKHLNSNGVVTDYFTLIKEGIQSKPNAKGEGKPQKNKHDKRGNNTSKHSFYNEHGAHQHKPHGVQGRYGEGQYRASKSEHLKKTEAFTQMRNNVAAENQYLKNRALKHSNIADELQTHHAVPAAQQDHWRYVARFQQGVEPGEEYNHVFDTTIGSTRVLADAESLSRLLADGNDKGTQWAAFIRWDVTAIPEEAIIHSVVLELNVEDSSSGDYSIYAAQTPWAQLKSTPSDVQWADVKPKHNMKAPVGGFTPSQHGKYAVSLNANGLNMVKSWVQGENNGILILSNGTSNGVDISSSDEPKSELRPRLIVRYTLGTH